MGQDGAGKEQGQDDRFVRRGKGDNTVRGREGAEKHRGEGPAIRRDVTEAQLRNHVDGRVPGQAETDRVEEDTEGGRIRPRRGVPLEPQGINGGD
jgi:hypothetical protein